MKFGKVLQVIRSLIFTVRGSRIGLGGNTMPSFGDYYNNKRKKLKKSELEKKAQKQLGSSAWQLPRVEIIKKGKKDW